MVEVPNSPATTFSELHRSLWDRIVDLTLAQMANVRIRPSDGDARKRHVQLAIDMRESLEYRFSSIGLHVALLSDHQRRGLAELVENFIAGNRDGFNTTYTARRQQQMLFDSVVFNILALFDYIGNAVGFSFYGIDSGGTKWKWKRGVQYARNPDVEERQHGARRYSTSAVAALVEGFDHKWINRLNEYRAELIHYKTD